MTRNPTSFDGNRAQHTNNPFGIPPQFGIPFRHSVAGYMMEVFLYGINIMLFPAAAYLLLRRGEGITRWLLFGSAAAMFAISTASVSMSMHILFNFLIHGTRVPTSIARSKLLFYLANNMIADTLLISRCYSVWSQSITIILFPSVLLAATSIFGVVFVSGPLEKAALPKYIYLWLTLGLNILVTALTASRIWWMARKAGKVFGPDFARRYYSTMAIIVESGAIYSLYVILDQVLITFKVLPFVFEAPLAQIAKRLLYLH